MSKLLNSLYTIKIIDSAENSIKAEVVLDKTHEIFKGHFPSQPVLPGVTMVEMIKDILQLATGQQYSLSKGNTIKFLKVVDPGQFETLSFDLSIASVDNDLKVVATSTLSDGEANFKFKGIFVK
ncbi:MAG: hypothetical protein ABJH05_04385 [Fulvivirga sp.]